MLTIAYISLGGAIGAVLRYLTTFVVVEKLGAQPFYSTFAVNIIGSFLMGALVTWLAHHHNPALRSLLVVGLFGAFTTFSTFSLDLWVMIERQQFIMLFAYAVGSVILGLSALIIGVYLSKGLLP